MDVWVTGCLGVWVVQVFVWKPSWNEMQSRLSLHVEAEMERNAQQVWCDRECAKCSTKSLVLRSFRIVHAESASSRSAGKDRNLKAQFSALDLTIKTSYAPNESTTVEEPVQNDILH
jgi:hypothetical protein